MPQVINSNILSLKTQDSLNKSKQAESTAIERLSSGLRINSAADDAAGESIANRFTASINGMNQAARNASDGISLAQTTEGALSEINNNLQRIRELAVQAQNATNSESDLQSIQSEITQHINEIESISQQTQFNNLFVLAKNTTFTIQAGADDGDTVDIHTTEVSGKTLKLDQIDVAHNPRLGEAVDKTVKDVDTPAPGVKRNTPIKLSDFIKSLTAPVPADADGQPLFTGDSKVHYLFDTHGEATGTYVLSGSDGNFYDIGIADDGKVSWSPEGTTTPVANEKVIPMKTVDNALTQIDTLRGNLGSVQNRLTTAIDNMHNIANNLSAARSRIEDADYAIEVSNMTRAQILQNSGSAVLSQANQVPQNVLTLLKNSS